MQKDLIYRACTVRLKEGERESYLMYHRQIWPEVEHALRKAGIEEYRIYITPDDQLFSVIGMKYPDSMERLKVINAGNETCTRWEELMSRKQMPCTYGDGGWYELDMAFDLNREGGAE